MRGGQLCWVPGLTDSRGYSRPNVGPIEVLAAPHIGRIVLSLSAA